MSQLSHLRRATVPALLGVAGLLGATAAQAQSLKLLLSPPGVQATSVAGAATETFNGLSTGALNCSPAQPLAIGSCSAASGASIIAFDQYGGAGGTGKYLGVNRGAVTIENLPNPRRYLGFWWSAGDATNQIRFYDQDDNLLATFTTSTLTGLLSGTGTLTTLGGGSYNKSAFYGNPNPPAGRNTGEPYAYVNLILSGTSARFAKIVITGTSGTSTFELDNVSVATSAQPEDGWVPMPDVPVTVPASAIAAADDAAYTSAGTAVPINVASNDPAWASGTPGYQLDGPNGGAAHGTVIISPAGVATYTPAPGFSGVDTFTYLRCKPAPNQTECAPATVTVTAIDAVNDSNATSVNTPVGGSVTGNDSVPAGVYSVPGAATTAGGTVSMTAAGGYTYTPASGFAGMDSFSYQACLPSPNQTVCDTAQVFIAVAPVANADSGTTLAGTPLRGNLTTNDLGATAPGASFAKATDPLHGTVTVNSDGTYIYTPASGYTGSDSFTYTLCVPNSTNPAAPLCSTATVNIQVAQPVPTLSQWALLLLSGLMGLGLARRRAGAR